MNESEKRHMSLQAMGFPTVQFGERWDTVIKFVSDLLGTVPKNLEAFTKFFLEKIPDKIKDVNGPNDEEVLTVEDTQSTNWTGFHQDEKGLFVYNYWVKGFLKTAIESLMQAEIIPKITAYKKWVDRLIFIYPRKLYFMKADPDGHLDRPLRASTPKGERITLTRSDLIAAGTNMPFTIELLRNSKGIDWEVLAKALTYGQYVGMGQWRGSGGYGQFQVKDFKVREDNDVINWPIKKLKTTKATKATKARAEIAA